MVLSNLSETLKFRKIKPNNAVASTNQKVNTYKTDNFIYIARIQDHENRHKENTKD